MKAYPISDNGEIIEIEVDEETAKRIMKAQLWQERKNEKRE